jgi:hypothetical protein
VEEVPTLLVTREVLETGNIFHVLTDLMNAYITLRMLGWEKRQRQARHFASATFFWKGSYNSTMPLARRSLAFIKLPRSMRGETAAT